VAELDQLPGALQAQAEVGDQGEAGIAAEEAGECGVALAALAVLLALGFDGGLVGQVAKILEVQEDAGGQGEADREGMVRAGGVADVGPLADQRHLVQVGAVQAGLP
jgi:hypothetical protein